MHAIPLAPLEDRFHRISDFLASVRDVIGERASAEPPSWCDARGFTVFLSALDDDELLSIERDGLAQAISRFPHAPKELRALAEATMSLTTLERASTSDSIEVDPRRANPRKRAQVAALSSLVRELPRSERVVDLGAGHGHLTRHLARELRIDAEGWERDPARVAVARDLAASSNARFAVVDLVSAAHDLQRDDLIVALHACGSLADLAVETVHASSSSLCLVPCCHQKRFGDRDSLTEPRNTELRLGREVLGLANARDGDVGIEADLAQRIASRERRHALRLLLLESGVDVQPGEEMRGINRRRSAGDFRAFVHRAFAIRSLSFPSEAAIERALRTSHFETSRARRWELPRTMLARLIEVWIAFDRAVFLARRGLAVRVVEAFPREHSPRNIALLSWSR